MDLLWKFGTVCFVFELQTAWIRETQINKHLFTTQIQILNRKVKLSTIATSLLTFIVCMVNWKMEQIFWNRNRSISVFVFLCLPCFWEFQLDFHEVCSLQWRAKQNTNSFCKVIHSRWHFWSRNLFMFSAFLFGHLYYEHFSLWPD